jgi:hypothetical protein
VTATANPDPEWIMLWRIPSPYEHARCAFCGAVILWGELVSIDYEGGVVHALCYDV